MTKNKITMIITPVRTKGQQVTGLAALHYIHLCQMGFTF